MHAFSVDGVGYGAGHFLENQFSARYGVHQGACSALLMPRVLHFHRRESRPAQERVAACLGRPGAASAAAAVHALVERTPAVPTGYGDVADQVDEDDFANFAEYLFTEHSRVLNKLCPRPFHSADDVLELLQAHPDDFD